MYCKKEQNISTQTSSNAEYPHQVISNNDNDIRYEPSNLQFCIFILMLLVPTIQLIYFTIDSGECALLLLALPLALLVCFLAKLLSLNKHPLLVNKNGIQYTPWQKHLGTDFFSWNDIHSISDFYMQGIGLVLITLHKNKIAPNSSKSDKSTFFTKSGNSFGDIGICTNNIKGNHDKILNTIMNMYRLYRSDN